MYVAVKTGDMAVNHAKSNMNAIQLQCRGEMIISEFPRTPQREQFRTHPQNRFYELTAREHNTICVAERDHQIDAQGRILESKNAKNYRWVLCDSGGACGQGVQFLRHVVMIVDPKTSEGHTVIVLDELTSGSPEKFEQCWHTPGQVNLDPNGEKATITGVRGELYLALASTVKTAVTLKSASIDSHSDERILHVSGGAIGKVLITSIFSTNPINSDIAIAGNEEGVTIDFDDTKAIFTNTAMHLELTEVRNNRT
jgi:hypothetical protein